MGAQTSILLAALYGLVHQSQNTILITCGIERSRPNERPADMVLMPARGITKQDVLPALADILVALAPIMAGQEGACTVFARLEGRIKDWKAVHFLRPISRTDGSLTTAAAQAQPKAMPKKFMVVQDLAQLRDLYRNMPPLFTDETGKPIRNGSTIRAPDGKLTRAMTINDRFAALRPRTDQR